MANVGFKLGLQDTVNDLLALGTGAKVVEGSFYLTSDTHRLYIGNADGSLSSVNEGVVTVANITDLPSVNKNNQAAYVGRFYYVSNANILCVFNGSGWAQINTDTEVRSVRFQTASTTADKEVTLTQSIQNWNGTSNTTLREDQMVFEGKNGVHVTAVPGTVDKDNKRLTLPKVVFEGDTYTLGTAAGTDGEVKVTLDSDKVNDNDSEIVFGTGSYTGETDVNIQLERTSDGKIVFKTKDTSNKKLEITPKTSTKDNPQYGFDVVLTDTHNADVAAVLNPSVKYGTGGKVEARYENGSAVLNVYSMEEINETLRVLNAMTYRGTIGAEGTVAFSVTMNTSGDPTKGCVVKDSAGKTVDVSIGDTFLVVGNTVKYNSKTLSANTLLIARSTDGTEKADGIIDNSKLIFDVVASTVDIDTTYRIETSTISDTTHEGAKWQLYDENAKKEAGGVAIKVEKSAGNETGLSMTVKERTFINGKDSADGYFDTWEIKHGETAFTLTDKDKFVPVEKANTRLPTMEYTTKVVTNVEVNASGHVTGFTLKEMPITDTNGQIVEMEQTASAYNPTDTNLHVGVFNTKITELFNTGKDKISQQNMAFTSTSLKIATGGDIATTAGGQTTAKSLSIDMVWGTF